MCSNTTCGWRARVDYRKLDNHIKKISCSSFINKVKWVIWRIQGVLHLSKTTDLNQVFLENPFTLLKDELWYGDIKNAWFCTTTHGELWVVEVYLHITHNYTFTDHNLPHGKWWHKIVHFYVSIVLLNERYLTKLWSSSATLI